MVVPEHRSLTDGIEDSNIWRRVEDPLLLKRLAVPVLIAVQIARFVRLHACEGEIRASCFDGARNRAVHVQVAVLCMECTVVTIKCFVVDDVAVTGEIAVPVIG